MMKPVSEYDFFNCWHQLTAPQKKALYDIAKIFADSNPEDAVEQERWQMITEAREEYLRDGKSYTWEEVKQMVRDRHKNNGLSA